MKKIAFILFLSLCMFACKSEEKPSDKAQELKNPTEELRLVNYTLINYVSITTIVELF